MASLENSNLNPDHIWLFRYSLPCHGGNIKIFNGLIESGKFKPLNYLNERKISCSSQMAVRTYFASIHNSFTEGTHKLEEYSVKDIIYKESKVFFSDVRKAKVLGVIEKEYRLKKDDRIFYHGDFIVDIDKEEDTRQ